MKIGDTVMVEVSRDRERGGRVIGVLDSGEVSVQFDATEAALNVPPNKVRSLSVATKHDQEKTMLHLIPYEAIEGIGKAMTYGAKKYSEDNWRAGFKWRRLFGSILRHGFAWLSGEDNDKESGLPHLYHMGAGVCMLIAHVDSNLGEDDRG